MAGAPGGSCIRMIWTRAEHEKDALRLVLSDSNNGDVDLRLPTDQAGELGRALYLGGSAYGVRATSIDDGLATLSVANEEIVVIIEHEAPYRFVLGADDARALGASILARPVTYEVECPRCGRRSWAQTTIAPTGEIAEARSRAEQWSCPKCGHRVASADLTESDDDVWRVPPRPDA
jgi:predicted nucleic-acid-binding Zn-ribbon protein